MKNRLLQAMKSLPMLAEDKEKFVDVIINNSNSGGGSKLGYLYFKTGYYEEDENGYHDFLTYFLQYIEFIEFNATPIIKELNSNSVLHLPQFGSGVQGDLMIAIQNYIPKIKLTYFYDIIPFLFENAEQVTRIFKNSEITEEEFLNGVQFGLPEM